MKVLFILLPFGIVLYNLIRAWQKREHSGLFLLTVACTAILLCAALFTAAVFLGHGGVIAMLRSIAPGQKSTVMVLIATGVAMGTVAVSWFGSAFCLFRKIKGWQTVLLLNMALGIFEAAMLLQIMFSL